MFKVLGIHNKFKLIISDPPIVINKEFENSEDCIHITDPNTETDDINEGADDLLGFRPKALSSPESMKLYKPPHDPERY